MVYITERWYKQIATHINKLTGLLAEEIQKYGYLQKKKLL
jgi:hypothetical protein